MSNLESLDFTLYFNNTLHKVTATPYLLPAKDGMPLCFQIMLDGKNAGDLLNEEGKLRNDNIEDKLLLEHLWNTIFAKFNERRNVAEPPALEKEKLSGESFKLITR